MNEPRMSDTERKEFLGSIKLHVARGDSWLLMRRQQLASPPQPCEPGPRVFIVTDDESRRFAQVAMDRDEATRLFGMQRERADVSAWGGSLP